MLAYSKAVASAVVSFLAPITTYLEMTGEWSWRWFAASVLTGASGFAATWATKTDPAALEAPRPPSRHLARKD